MYLGMTRKSKASWRFSFKRTRRYQSLFTTHHKHIPVWSSTACCRWLIGPETNPLKPETNPLIVSFLPRIWSSLAQIFGTSRPLPKAGPASANLIKSSCEVSDADTTGKKVMAVHKIRVTALNILILTRQEESPVDTHTHTRTKKKKCNVMCTKQSTAIGHVCRYACTLNDYYLVYSITEA